MPPTEKEKAQKFQEKYQAILSALLKEEDNKYCADCDAKGPRWASWNLGVFVCIRCAGIHRNLGVHISRVKSVNLDQWTAEQIASMQSIGNAKSRSIYEANIPETFRRSQTDSAMEQFIRNKYEQRKWIAKEWTQPTITVSSDLKEDENSNTKRKTTKSAGINLDNSFSSMKLDPAASKQKKTPTPKPISPTSQQQQQQQLPTVAKKNETSLLDLEPNDVFSPSNGTFQGNQSENQLDLFNLGPAVETNNQAANNSESLFATDFFNNMPDKVDSAVQAKTDVTASPVIASVENNDLADLMTSSGSTTTGGKAMDKNSILALYGQASKTPTPAATPTSNNNMFPGNSGFMTNPHVKNGNQTNSGGFMGMSNSNRGLPQQQQQQISANFGMNQMNMFGQNPYNQPTMNIASSSNSQDLFEAFSSHNTFPNNSNSGQAANTMPNIGNTLLTDLWQ